MMKTLDLSHGMQFARIVEQLLPISRRMHRWQERCCNEDISDARAERFDRKIAAEINEILDGTGLSWYEQGDCRGCPLYLYDQADLDRRNAERGGTPWTIDRCYSSIGYAVIRADD
jgi:hypothetical protein